MTGMDVAVATGAPADNAAGGSAQSSGGDGKRAAAAPPPADPMQADKQPNNQERNPPSPPSPPGILKKTSSFVTQPIDDGSEPLSEKARRRQQIRMRKHRRRCRMLDENGKRVRFDLKRLCRDSITVVIPMHVTADMKVVMERTRAKRLARLRQAFPQLAAAAGKTESDRGDEEDQAVDDDDENTSKKKNALVPVKKKLSDEELQAQKKKLIQRRNVVRRSDFANTIEYLEAKYVQGVNIDDESDTGGGGGDGGDEDEDEDSEGAGSVYSQTSFLDDTELQRSVANQVVAKAVATKVSLQRKAQASPSGKYMVDDDEFFVNVGALEVEESEMTSEHYNPLADVDPDSKLNKNKKVIRRKRKAEDGAGDDAKSTASSGTAASKKKNTEKAASSNASASQASVEKKKQVVIKKKDGATAAVVKKKAGAPNAAATKKKAPAAVSPKKTKATAPPPGSPPKKKLKKAVEGGKKPAPGSPSAISTKSAKSSASTKTAKSAASSGTAGTAKSKPAAASGRGGSKKKKAVKDPLDELVDIKKTVVDQQYEVMKQMIKAAVATGKELPLRKTKDKVAITCPADKKPGVDTILFSNPHVPGQRLRVKIPKTCKPGGVFKVTVPIAEVEPVDDGTDHNRLSRDFYDRLDDYARAYDDWCDAVGNAARRDGNLEYTAHFEKRKKFDELVSEFPKDLKSPIDVEYLKKLLRRARQNRSKREQTLAKNRGEDGSVAPPAPAPQPPPLAPVAVKKKVTKAASGGGASKVMSGPFTITGSPAKKGGKAPAAKQAPAPPPTPPKVPQFRTYKQIVIMPHLSRDFNYVQYKASDFAT